MPNAKDLKTGDSPRRFLVIGKQGAGKSSLFLTLPGRKFMYAFDANTLSAIEGFDVEYEAFLPDQLTTKVHTLKKGGSSTAGTRRHRAEAYLNWEQDFGQRSFDDYDWIGWDSWTTFADIIMDHVLDLNGRPGQFPHQDDWGPQMVALNNIFRTAAGMGKGIFCAAHEELVKDEISGKVQNQILITGKLRQRLPILFSDVYHCTCEIDKASKRVSYMVQTRPDRENPNCRSSIRGIDTFVDVTIEDFRNPENYGLGAILRKAKGGSYGNLRQPTRPDEGGVPAAARN